MQDAWTLVQARVNGKTNRTRVSFHVHLGTELQLSQRHHQGTANQPSFITSHEKPYQRNWWRTTMRAPRSASIHKSSSSPRPPTSPLTIGHLRSFQWRILLWCRGFSYGIDVTTFLLNWQSLTSVQMNLKGCLASAKQCSSTAWKRRTKIWFPSTTELTPHPNHKLSTDSNKSQMSVYRGLRAKGSSKKVYRQGQPYQLATNKVQSGHEDDWEALGLLR